MTTHHLLNGTSTKSRSTVSPTAFRVAVGSIGLIVGGLLIVQGTLVSAAALSVLAATTTLALIMLIVLGASAPELTAGRRTLLHTLVPVAGGLSVIAIVVGRAVFLGELGWWIPAALISAVPIFVVATLPSRRPSP